jgi:hypothetical protein
MEFINKVLSDFAKVNSDQYVSNDYELILLSEDIQEDIEELAKKTIYITENDTIELIPLKEWRKDFLNCSYPDSEKYWFGTIPHGYDLNGLTTKEYIIEQLLKQLGQEIEEVYLVNLYTENYYACSDEEYIFKTNKGIYFLSMQVHD